MIDKLSARIETVIPNAADSELAKESMRRLAVYVGNPHGPLQVQIKCGGSPEEMLTIPSSVAQALLHILADLAMGRTICLSSSTEYLSRVAAGETLNVSPTAVDRLVAVGALPSVNDGKEYKIPAVALLLFRQELLENRLNTLAELTEQAQELGMGY